MSLDFELSPELIDNIAFGMENQDHEFYLDTEEGRLVEADEVPEADRSSEESGGDRFVHIPEWRSVDGFHLMERFVDSLHNPVYREQLRNILSSGRGVFRQFKNALKERKDIEQLWFRFKEREMRRIVVEWYNDLREAEGLSRVPPLDEAEVSTEELVAADFLLDRIELAAEELEELDKRAFAELFPQESPPMRELLRELARAGTPGPGEPSSLILGARTPAGELAGFLWAVDYDAADEEEKSEERLRRVLQLYVLKEFRGLGIARTLVHELCRRSKSEQITYVLFELRGNGAVLEGFLEREGAEPLVDELVLEMETWSEKGEL